MDQKQFTKGITPADPNTMPEDLQLLYREMNPILLADLLIQLGLFGTLKTPDDVSRHNFAVEILVNCGTLGTEQGGTRITPASMAECVRRLLGNELVTIDKKEA